MRKYEVIEDNGGGLTLVVFNKNGKVDYLHSGYEYGKHGRLICDLEALKNGDNPVTDWDGNEDNPQAVYDNIVSFEYGGWPKISGRLYRGGSDRRGESDAAVQ